MLRSGKWLTGKSPGTNLSLVLLVTSFSYVSIVPAGKLNKILAGEVSLSPIGLHSQLHTAILLHCSITATTSTRILSSGKDIIGQRIEVFADRLIDS
jgi:hypothetical protein